MTEPDVDQHLAAYFNQLRGEATPAHVNSIRMEDVMTGKTRIGAAVGSIMVALAMTATTTAAVIVSHHVRPVPTPAANVVSSSAAGLDVSGARAAAVAYFAPPLRFCWTEVIRTLSEGSKLFPDDYSGCPVTPRLAHQLRDRTGTFTVLKFFIPTIPLPPHMPTVNRTLRVDPAVATASGATVRVFAEETRTLDGRTWGPDTFEDDAILVHTQAGWLIDDILIHGHYQQVPPLVGVVPTGVVFVPDASGSPISIYDPCTMPRAGGTQGCVPSVGPSR